jgi:hypothetical protein
MPSTFSPNLRIELIGPGEQAGTWGTTTNTNLGTLVEDAISGYETVSVTTANQALTYADGTADQARNAMIELTTTTGAAFNVYAPPSPKTYIIYNASAHAATIYNSTVAGNTTAAGTGVTIPAGKTASVWTSGANFAYSATVLAPAALDQVYPVGSIYLNAINATNPATLLGFGTWAAFGAGRVPVGFNAADPLFDTAEKVGGSKNAIVVSHAHSGTTGNQSNDHAHGFSGSTGGQSANHTHTGATDVQGVHAHGLPSNIMLNALNEYQLGGTGTAIVGNFNGTTDAAGAHAHNVSTGLASNDHSHAFSGGTGGVNANHNHAFTTAAVGSDGTNANLQPYITVYMWKRVS